MQSIRFWVSVIFFSIGGLCIGTILFGYSIGGQKAENEVLGRTFVITAESAFGTEAIGTVQANSVRGDWEIIGYYATVMGPITLDPGVNLSMIDNNYVMTENNKPIIVSLSIKLPGWTAVSVEPTNLP